MDILNKYPIIRSLFNTARLILSIFTSYGLFSELVRILFYDANTRSRNLFNSLYFIVFHTYTHPQIAELAIECLQPLFGPYKVQRPATTIDITHLVTQSLRIANNVANRPVSDDKFYRKLLPTTSFPSLLHRYPLF